MVEQSDEGEASTSKAIPRRKLGHVAGCVGELKMGERGEAVFLELLAVVMSSWMARIAMEKDELNTTGRLLPRSKHGEDWLGPLKGIKWHCVPSNTDPLHLSE